VGPRKQATAAGHAAGTHPVCRRWGHRKTAKLLVFLMMFLSLSILLHSVHSLNVNDDSGLLAVSFLLSPEPHLINEYYKPDANAGKTKMEKHMEIPPKIDAPDRCLPTGVQIPYF